MKDIQFFDNNLNPSQKEAVKFCLESPEVACIHGPPGMCFFNVDVAFILNLPRHWENTYPHRNNPATGCVFNVRETS